MASAGEALAIGLGGGFASVFARCLVYPADVLRTVYVTKGKEGVKKLTFVDLYRGIYPAIVDAFAFHAANFGIYELLKGVYFRFTRGAAAAAQIGAPLPVAVRLSLLSRWALPPLPSCRKASPTPPPLTHISHRSAGWIIAGYDQWGVWHDRLLSVHNDHSAHVIRAGVRRRCNFNTKFIIFNTKFIVLIQNASVHFQLPID